MATRFLSLAEVLDLYGRVLVAGGGSSAIRDLGALESALAQPRATFDDVELYPTLIGKAAALGFSLGHALLRQFARHVPELPRRVGCNGIVH